MGQLFDLGMTKVLLSFVLESDAVHTGVMGQGESLHTVLSCIAVLSTLPLELQS